MEKDAKKVKYQVVERHLNSNRIRRKSQLLDTQEEAQKELIRWINCYIDEDENLGTQNSMFAQAGFKEIKNSEGDVISYEVPEDIESFRDDDGYRTEIFEIEVDEDED